MALRAHPTGEAAGVGEARRSGPGVCVYAISGRHRRAHGRRARRRRACGSPTSPRRSQTAAARRPDPRVPARVEPGRLRRPAGRRRARPQDPRRDPRRQERRHPRDPDHRRGRDVQRAVHARHHRGREDHDEADLRGVGRARRAPTTRTTSACSTAACPVFRTFHNCVAAVKSYADYWTFVGALPLAVRRRADRRRCPRRSKARKLLDGLAAGRGAVGVGLEAAARARTASRRRRTSCARRRPRRCRPRRRSASRS